MQIYRSWDADPWQIHWEKWTRGYVEEKGGGDTLMMASESRRLGNTDWDQTWTAQGAPHVPESLLVRQT